MARGNMGTGTPLGRFRAGKSILINKRPEMKPLRGDSGRPHAAEPALLYKVGSNSTASPGSMGDYNKKTRTVGKWQELPGWTHGSGISPGERKPPKGAGGE